MVRSVVGSVAVGLVVMAMIAPGGVHAGPRMDLGDNFNSLTDTVASPHVPWAKPLPDGPIRTLFFVPRCCARDAVELTQRVDMDVDTILFFKEDTFGHPLTRIDIAGACEPDKIGRLREKLSYPWDLLVIGKVHFDAFPSFARERIMELVSEGTGLLVVYPDPAFDAAVDGLDAQPAPAFEDILPLASCVPFAGAADAAAVRSKHIRMYRKGAGRIGSLSFPGRAPWRASLTPDEPMPAYEVHQSLLACMALHLANRKPPLSLAEHAAGDDYRRRVIRAQGARLAEVQLTVSVVDAENAPEYTHTIILPPGSDAVSVEYLLPTLKDGGHIVQWIARRAGASVGWGGRSLVVDSPVKIEDLVLDQLHFEKQQAVTGHITLSQPLVDGQRLVAFIRDNHGRRVGETDIPSAGDVDVPLTLAADDSLTPINHVVVEIRDGNTVLALRRAEMSIPDRSMPDDFYFVGWGGTGGEAYSAQLAGKALRDAGLDAVSGGGFKRAGVRNPELSNIRKIPYAWRVAAHYDRHVKEGVRSPCLTDPKYRAAERETFITRTKECDAFGVPAYHLGDESYYMLYDPHHGLGSCYSETCQAGFRKFLSRDYGTIEALNAEWGTTYPDWDAIRMTGAGDFADLNEAPRMDHLRYTEFKFRDAHNFAIDCIQEVDATARVGLEGLESLCASWGIDWYPLLERFRLLCVYPYEQWTTKDMNRHCVRSFARPDTLLGMWYGGYVAHRDETVERWFPWYSLFLGFNSIWWYDVGKPGEVFNGLAPDYSMVKHFRQTTEEIAEIKRGAGKLIMSSRRVSDNVAIHYSYRSAVIDLLDMPAQFERKPGMYKQATAAFINLVEDLGLSFDMVATEEIEAGALQNRGYSVLIMPCVQVLTRQETEQITTFVQEGGVVVADYLAGIRDAHGVILESFPIDAIFGIKRTAHQDVFRGEVRLSGSAYGLHADLTMPDTEIELFGEATTAQHLGAQVSSFKAGLVNQFGKGKALYLNFPLTAYVKDRLRGLETEQLDFFRDVFAWAGVRPVITVASGSRALPGMRMARFSNGPIDVVMLYKDLWRTDKTPEFGWVDLGRSACVYDVRRKIYLGETDRVARTFHPGRMEVFALAPYEITGLRATAGAHDIAPGTHASVTFEVLAGDTKVTDHVLHVTVIGPDGAERRHYGRNVIARGGATAFEIPMASNDPDGRWLVEAEEVISGHKACAAISVLSRK